MERVNLRMGALCLKRVDAIKKHKEPEERRLLMARSLCSLYHQALRGAVLDFTKAARLMPIRKLGQVDKTARRCFYKAADICLQLEAEPLDYITAQFKRFSEISEFKKKQLLPQPQHLGSLGAQVRYLEYMQRKEERFTRQLPTVQIGATDAREERKLKGLARITRMLPEDVLTSRPEEFSKEFLMQKGVWELVRKAWMEAQAS